MGRNTSTSAGLRRWRAMQYTGWFKDTSFGALFDALERVRRSCKSFVNW